MKVTLRARETETDISFGPDTHESYISPANQDGLVMSNQDGLLSFYVCAMYLPFSAYRDTVKSSCNPFRGVNF